MATKHHSDNEDGFGEIDELEDPEFPEMGGEDEEMLMPKNTDETELEDAELEKNPEEEE